ncbi:hypothetical protein [Agathobaculum sp.]|uniref:hypothetical protein n=1 Tax=Agathobaculum sp. TaxID=2048138 RepID=UPI002A812374|nr:hypothetical protein [Agathobaculum sp.]MDY3618136.1 hypothetical protein [Agathobaculum sp.]
MNMNDLQKLQDIKTPDELKAKTLSAAREMRRSEQADQPQHLAAAPRRRFGMAKRILAAACAFGVIVGGTAIWKTRGTGEPAGDAVANAVANTFGLVAYAADSREVMEPKDSKIVFDSGSGADDLENGFFSGCLFRVTGENIKTVSASIDKGSLYRAKTIEIGKDDVQGMHMRTDPRIDGASQVMVYGIGDEEIDHWYADLCWKLENGFTEDYDPDASYGFWAPTESEIAGEEDLQQAWHNRIDTFDGAKLSVTVTFTDGATQTRTMDLKTGKLACEYIDDVSGPQLTGEVLTDEQAETQGYLYGVYAELA